MKHHTEPIQTEAKHVRNKWIALEKVVAFGFVINAVIGLNLRCE